MCKTSTTVIIYTLKNNLTGMENSGDEVEEDENEWKTSLVDFVPLSPQPTSVSGPRPSQPSHRVIVHFDMDCFYAQVEMIRNPALRDVPLGIQQKNIIVTCNYVAREQGVTKLMYVTDAVEKCPQLVLVKGEDLTHYREMSYKVTELLMSFCPLVERLGFDENFIDITSMVEKRLVQKPDPENVSFEGHVYSCSSANAEVGEHLLLAVGSHIAAELREQIHSKLGLTGCAGIATNKLLAKLVSGTFKPSQQTTLLPENVKDIMEALSVLRKIPGVGHQTAKRLGALGLVSVKDLQLCPLNSLVKEFGGPSAQRLKNLAEGIDESPVRPTGAPQSLSDEDSFKKISSTREVLEKIQELLSSLVERMHKDGRQPQTFRLTIRKYSATNKWFNRESRQCPIPNHVGQKIGSGGGDDAVALLVPFAMKLFHKMVDSSCVFHLTLINVCFSNLQTRKGQITSFFTHSTSPRKTQHPSTSQSQDISSSANDGLCLDFVTQEQETLSVHRSGAAFPSFKRKQSVLVAEDDHPPLKVSRVTERSNRDLTNDTATQQLPPNVDPEVFRILPEEIQKELMSAAFASSPFNAPASSQTSTDLENVKDETEDKGDGCDVPTSAGLWLIPGKNVTEEGRQPHPQPPDSEFPGNVDPEVFSELPPDVQREIMNEWKQQKRVVKIPTSSKPTTNCKNKDRKSAGKSRQTNDLFKYFKPS